MALAKKIETFQVVKLHTNPVAIGLLCKLDSVLHVINQNSPVLELRVRHEIKQEASMLPVEEFSHLERLSGSRCPYQEPDSLVLPH